MLLLLASAVFTFNLYFELPAATPSSVELTTTQLPKTTRNNTITKPIDTGIILNDKGKTFDYYLTEIRAFAKSHLHWLALFWAIGVVALSVRLVGSWWWLQQLKHQHLVKTPTAWKAKLTQLCQRYGIRQMVDLRFSKKVVEPVSFGHFKPVILLPISLINQLPVEQVELVLLHELAHIRRYDYLVNWLQSIIEILFFYHPVTWWISRQLRTTREHCCDDWVVNQPLDRVAYAQALTAVQKWTLHKQRTSLSLGFIGQRSVFARRIQRLMMPSQNYSNKVYWIPIAGLSVLTLMTVFYWDNLLAQRPGHPETQILENTIQEIQQEKELKEFIDFYNLTPDDFNPLDIPPRHPNLAIPSVSEAVTIRTLNYTRPVANNGRSIALRAEVVIQPLALGIARLG
ncbi:MAG: M56 family metallopeptidase, partial [Bacteroidota bacterium]